METDCNCLWKPLQVQRCHPPGQGRPVHSSSPTSPTSLLLSAPLQDLAACQRFVWHCTKPQTSRALTAATVAEAGAWSQTLGKLLGQRKVYLIFVQCPATCPFLTLLIKTNCALLQVRQSKARDNTQQRGSRGMKGGREGVKHARQHAQA